MIKISSKNITKVKTYKTGRNEMGLAYAEIELTNGGDSYMFLQGMIEENEIKQITLNALIAS